MTPSALRTRPWRLTRAWLGVLALLAIAGCGARDRAAEELDIRETVYRYQLGTDLHRGDEGPHLAIVVDGQDRDPDDAFMQRFVNQRPIVRKVSECEYFPGRGMRNKKTGRRSIVLITATITWLSSGRVLVKGGYNLGSSSVEDTFHLSRTFGQWRVTKRERRSSS